MDLVDMYYVGVNEQGKLYGSRMQLFEPEEIEVAEQILHHLDGYSIVLATSILRRCEYALQQANFCEKF